MNFNRDILLNDKIRSFDGYKNFPNFFPHYFTILFISGMIYRVNVSPRRGGCLQCSREIASVSYRVGKLRDVSTRRKELKMLAARTSEGFCGHRLRGARTSLMESCRVFSLPSSKSIALYEVSLHVFYFRYKISGNRDFY